MWKTNFRKINIVAAYIAVSIIVLGCSPSSDTEEQLAIRAVEWVELLDSIAPSNRDDRLVMIERIAGYLEPSPVREARAQFYYEQRAGLTGIVPYEDFSVDEVLYHSDSNASVRIKIAYRATNGGLNTDSQITSWIRIDGVWYRILENAAVL
jgi:hypothetical protein